MKQILQGVCEKDNCSNQGKLYYTFGDYICKDCLDKQSTERDGHSGMVEKDISIQDFYEYGLEGINLVKVKKSNPYFVKLFFEHYPESKGIIGRQLNYIVYCDEKPIGIIGFASPIYNYKKFKNFFNKDDPDRLSKITLNNNVYRLKKSEKNLGTKVLKKSRQTVYIDYMEEYNDNLIGLCTFVKKPLDGALYKADNWNYLGESEGIKVHRRNDWKEKDYEESTKKHVFCYDYPEEINQKLRHNHLYKSFNHSIRGKYSRLQWLCTIEGIGEKRAESILDFGFDKFLKIKKEKYTKINGIGAKTSNKIYKGLKSKLFEMEEKSVRKENRNYWKNKINLFMEA